MKRLITILTILELSIATMAQVPQKISYQALIRDAENEIVANRVITLQIQLVTANGDAVYSETHQTATNANGVISVAIGTGNTTDDFSQIDWSKGEYYVQTTTDLGAGEKIVSDASQLLSVPYALYAEKAGNVIEIDLSGYALKEEIPAPTDLTNYVKSSDLAEYAKTTAVNDTLSAYLLQKDAPTKVSQLENDANYITLSEVPETDLSGYYTKSEVNDTLSAYLLQKDAPTKVSQLENDANYITLNEVPETDLSGYYTKSAVNDTLSAYLLQKDASTKVSQLENDANYITLSEVPETDLSGYYTKSEVNDTLSAYLLQKDAPTKVSQFENDASYITLNEVPATDLSDYYTKTEVNDTLSAYMLQKNVSTKVSQFENDASYITLSEVPETDLSGYYTKSDVDGAFDDYATTVDLNTTFADYAKKDTLADYTKKSEVAGLVDLSKYYRKSEVEAMLADLNAKIKKLEKQLKPTGEIEFAFSVSDDEKIYFSQGNLQYQASTNTWRFAENQYDCILDDNKKISSSYAGWIDLFGWGTSGFNSKYPYMTSSSGGSYGDGASDIDGTNYDWGVYNAISNGGNQAGLWRTLTSDEWTYLIQTRQDASSKYGIATVNSVTGLVLLPDDWNQPNGVAFVGGMEGGFSQNIYSVSDWEKMETNGAVFLPAGGVRGVATVYNISQLGSYWSSTSVDNTNAYVLYFDTSNIHDSDQSNRCYGRCVRLVKSTTPKKENTSIKNGAIQSKFSVSESKQIRFSHGNLQYQASTNTWRFAERQYDMIGNDNENISRTYAGWIDLFGWGTSGWRSYAEAYQPYSSSNIDNAYNPGANEPYAGLTGDYANADWGVYNAISNGGNQAGMWRTLTYEEWDYLINSRANASSKYGVATVNNVNGLVFLPDDWTLPNGVTFTNGIANNEGADYYRTVNNYSAEDWSKMEANGAVFLPAGGQRNGTSMYNDSRVGFYWSSSIFESQYSSYCLRFNSSETSMRSFYRFYGLSVRLVQDAE